MITVKNVTKIFSSNDWSLKALDDISENFREGEITAICGPSGSGKSTLLNAIASIENIDSGSIFVDSDDISKFSNIQLNEYRNKKIGIVFQSYFLEPSFSVAKNVSIPLLINNTSNKEVEERVNEQLIALGIINLKNKKTCLLSGGEKQRVCIARALINNPKIILADEPCGNLDSKNSKNIMDILLSLKKEGKIIILVTHNEADAKRCDRIIRLCDGQIV